MKYMVTEGDVLPSFLTRDGLANHDRTVFRHSLVSTKMTPRAVIAIFWQIDRRSFLNLNDTKYKIKNSSHLGLTLRGDQRKSSDVDK